MYPEITTEQMRLLTALFGERHDASYDEETEANMRVRLNVNEMDRIVSVAFEDPLVVAN
jgi:hypothetical protein